MKGEKLVDAEVVGDCIAGRVGLVIAVPNNAVGCFDAFELAPAWGCVEGVDEVGCAEGGERVESG